MTGCGCQFTTRNSGPVWSPEDKAKPASTQPDRVEDLYRPDILEHIEATVKDLDGELRQLSLDIHGHPELKFEEYHAHDVLTYFMTKHGFEVTKQHHLDTAWLATYTHGKGGRTIGVNSEMDALPGIGHACGHNLIAIAGVGVAIAIKQALMKFNIAGKVALLGTPAEEGGNGKVILKERGAYKDMAACLMCHPAPGPIGSVSLSSSLAVAGVEVEYFGHTAHAALSPWEGRNALDAAVLGYNNISALRQQIPPTQRVHSLFIGKDWAPNIVPDHSKMLCYVRAPTRSEVQATLERVIPCLKAAALATGCAINITPGFSMDDLRQNKTLGNEVAHIITAKYGAIDYEWGIKSASTDFGNITYALPSLHPGFAIPTVKDGGNHTPQFEKAAATIEAHYACLDITKALAATGVRVLADNEFFAKVRKAFEEDEEIRKVLAL
ncbi:putative peptidase dimerisation domain containing protein [Lyophyllum shimeji]|uniref:Peptidase M20 domain-containing protein 2 n=1 Tax=Lyophyllum shimeji TaxID=47721 RepID=A0A9P3PPX7_LYOSH|nr:putative peptidase dimerisation domain containing protein [Lyophyllum shimeji]